MGGELASLAPNRIGWELPRAVAGLHFLGKGDYPALVRFLAPCREREEARRG